MSRSAHDDVAREGPRIPRRESRRGGFTLVELLISVAIIGILAALAIPNFKTVVIRARAAEVVGDMEVVKVATLSYNGTYHSWPGEAGPGVIPPELVPFLPEQYAFTRSGYDLDYEFWSLPGGLPGDPGTKTLIGVSVVIADPLLGNALLELLGSGIIFSVGNTHTIVIDRS